jgi:hypothetical protein
LCRSFLKSSGSSGTLPGSLARQYSWQNFMGSVSMMESRKSCVSARSLSVTRSSEPVSAL